MKWPKRLKASIETHTKIAHDILGGVAACNATVRGLFVTVNGIRIDINRIERHMLNEVPDWLLREYEQDVRRLEKLAAKK